MTVKHTTDDDDDGAGASTAPAEPPARGTAEHEGVVHDAAQRKFLLDDGAAFIEYAHLGWAVVDMFETFVPPALRGRGAAERLARGAFKFCAAAGLRVWPSCSYLAERFLPRNPDLAHVGLRGPPLTVTKPALETPVPWDSSMGRPAVGQVHLMPFLLPTEFCDAEEPSIVAKARELIPSGCSTAEAAARVRNWVRSEVLYVLDDKARRASETLASRGGMCTNKANLACALLRAAGVPAGYVMVHLKKEAYQREESLLPEMLERIADPTVHCYCAVFDQPAGVFRRFDATEALRGHPERNQYLEEDFVTGETFYKPELLAGPASPVQGSIDHLLSWRFPQKIDPALRERQNKRYREAAAAAAAAAVAAAAAAKRPKI